jgi:hypothetical protein
MIKVNIALYHMHLSLPQVSSVEVLRFKCCTDSACSLCLPPDPNIPKDTGEDNVAPHCC